MFLVLAYTRIRANLEESALSIWSLFCDCNYLRVSLSFVKSNQRLDPKKIWLYDAISHLDVRWACFWSNSGKAI